MRIGADERVWISKISDDWLAVELHLVPPAPYRLREIFQVDLIADAGTGRHHAELIERLLRPCQELVTYLVLPVLLLDILLEGIVSPEIGDRYRVIADESDGHQRNDLLAVAAERRRRVPHRA